MFDLFIFLGNLLIVPHLNTWVTDPQGFDPHFGWLMWAAVLFYGLGAGLKGKPLRARLAEQPEWTQGVGGSNPLIPTKKIKGLSIICLAPFLRCFHPETLMFPDVETGSFQSGNEHFFLLARNSSNYEEAYINTLTNNCAE